MSWTFMAVRVRRTATGKAGFATLQATVHATLRAAGLATTLALLSGCAAPLADGGGSRVAALADEALRDSAPWPASKATSEAATEPTRAPIPVSGASPTPDDEALLQAWLAAPVDADTAVRIALRHNPELQSTLAGLGLVDAERARAAALPAPRLALGRFAEGDAREIERWLRLDLVSLLTWPQRARWAGQQAELAQLAAAQDVTRLAADTRRAWVRAVTAAQTVRYLDDAREAADAGAELAERMARAGNWSRWQATREQTPRVDLQLQQARARGAAAAAREQLVRLLGLDEAAAARLRLPDRLPDLPAEPPPLPDKGISSRLDVRAARAEFDAVADSLGGVRLAGTVGAVDLGAQSSTITEGTTGARSTRRGFEVELPLPLFDPGRSANARAEALWRQAAARLRTVTLRAASETREAATTREAAWTLARHHRDALLPLRQRMSEELLLRYNGMFASVWELLADTRSSIAVVVSALEADRDFWLADIDLRLALTGTSPGALATFRNTSTTAPLAAQEH